MEEIQRVKFKPLTDDELRKYAVWEIRSKDLYRKTDLEPELDGPLSKKLGLSSNKGVCKTCFNEVRECPGHFGYIDLPCPVFQIGTFRVLLKILTFVCKHCARTLLTDEELIFYKQQLALADETDSKQELYKKVLSKCRSRQKCNRCGRFNGALKRSVHSLKLTHAARKPRTELFSGGLFEWVFNEREALAERSGSRVDFLKNEKELAKAVMLCTEPLHPAVARDLLRRTLRSDLCVIGVQFDPAAAVTECVPVCPSTARPSSRVSETVTNEDDLTVLYRDILILSAMLFSDSEQTRRRKFRNFASQNRNSFARFFDIMDQVQLQCSLVVNADLPNYPTTLKTATQKASKPLRSLAHRLKGKQGRFRGNLSGKRVNFAARSVVSPDPNLEVDEVGVPVVVARSLTVPERVTCYNLQFFKEAIRCNLVRPTKVVLVEKTALTETGAHQVVDSRLLKHLRNDAVLARIAERLSIGDVVHRSLRDGDFLLFNRQPSLHRNSLMGHRVKILPLGKTFRLNLCVCQPYNADFDGDEMNLHSPQNEPALADVKHLASVANNMLNPKTGSPVVAPIQDYITTAFLLTRKDCFLDKESFFRMGAVFLNPLLAVAVRPSVLKPRALYTGKQLFSLLLRSSFSDFVTNTELLLTFIHTNKYSKKGSDNCPKDGKVFVRNNCLLSGTLTKEVLGGSTAGILYKLFNSEFLFGSLRSRPANKKTKVDKLFDGKVCALRYLNNFSKLASVFLQQLGFSVGLDDVTPSVSLAAFKRECVAEAEAACVGVSEEEKLLASTAVRDKVSQHVVERLSFQHNSPFVMANCGSKGSVVNICQMVGCLGQQIIGGRRPVGGFGDRTFPHFALSGEEKSIAEKGFVENSFYSGLQPIEFFFHAMAGREGLIDTAVKTSETGYLQRRMIKSLEGLVVAYDYTVRDSDGRVIQFRFGEDGKDPCPRPGTAGSLLLEPGTAVGALSCQAVGEPGTQMTLKTFHFAGTTKMNITLGVPRVVEIINATKNIKNPITTFELEPALSNKARLLCKKLRSRTVLDLVASIKVVVQSSLLQCELVLFPDAVSTLVVLGHSLEFVRLLVVKELSKTCRLFPGSVLLFLQEPVSILVKLQPSQVSDLSTVYNLHAALSAIWLTKTKTVKEVVFQQEDNKTSLFAQASCLHAGIGELGVVFETAYTNDIHGMCQTLGIEAARSAIVKEVQYIFGAYGICVDIRHLTLLADYMTSRGKVFGLTRHDIKNFDSSVFKLASFEKTADILFDAVVAKKVDNTNSVSGSVILGKVPKFGSGSCEVKTI